MNSNVKNDFIIPIAVLTVICIVVSGALALTQQATAPIIEETARKNAEAARLEVLPGSGAFEPVALEGMPEGVTAVYKSDKGATVEVAVKGYGGTLAIIAGIDTDGKLVNSKVLSHSETAGLGSKVGDEPFRSQFVGKDKELAGVSTIGGATVSSKAFIGGIKKAFDAAAVAMGTAEPTGEPVVGVTETKLKAAFPNATSFTETEVDGTKVIVCGEDGFAIFTEGKGYESVVRVATLLDNDGVIVKVIVDEHGETENLGSEAAEDPFTDQFKGKTDAKVDAVAGATYTSDAVMSAVRDALDKFPAVKEGA